MLEVSKPARRKTNLRMYYSRGFLEHSIDVGNRKYVRVERGPATLSVV